MSDFDAIVVGAGVVGLACGYALAKTGLAVAVIERQARIGAGVSSRNSEVIHAGFYYPTGSLKARFCVEGPAGAVSIPDRPQCRVSRNAASSWSPPKTAKFPPIENYAKQAESNGVENMRWLSGAEARALEPQLRAVAAIEFLESGVMDAHGYMDALEGEIEAHGGAVVLNSPFLGATPTCEGYAIRVGGETPDQRHARASSSSPPASARKRARATVEGFPDRAHSHSNILAKGNYFALSVKAPFQRLIYPPPVPGALGTHYRRDLGGVARFGPDIEWVTEENYRRRSHARGELLRRRPQVLARPARRRAHAPTMPASARKSTRRDEPQPDFVLDSPADHGMEGLICLFGIESPGLTSSLAIGEGR